jgi:hypothetical protein
MADKQGIGTGVKTALLIILGVLILALSVGVAISVNTTPAIKAPTGNLEQCLAQISTFGVPADNKCGCLNVVIIGLEQWACTGAMAI